MARERLKERDKQEEGGRINQNGIIGLKRCLSLFSNRLVLSLSPN